MDVPAILRSIAADAGRGNIVFPTHTEIALRVQRLLDDPDCDINVLGKLISAEPMLSARVLGVANSTAYNPGGKTISDLKTAISRLGFAALRALAAAIVVRQMKDMSTSAEHRSLAARLWEHTAHVAALARVIARRVTRQNPDAAFFYTRGAGEAQLHQGGRVWSALPPAVTVAPRPGAGVAGQLTVPGVRVAERSTKPASPVGITKRSWNTTPGTAEGPCLM